MWTISKSSTLQVLIVGIVTILALSEGPSCSLALSTRRFLEDVSAGGGQFKLVHWSNPAAPHFNPDLTFVQRLQLAFQAGQQRVVSMTHPQGDADSIGPSVSTSPQPAPAAGPLSFESPLFNLVFEYGMDITIGTPAHKFSAIADTGSDLVWVQCAACDYCVSQPDPLFDPTKSKSYTHMLCSDPLCFPSLDTCTNMTCDYSYYYGSGATIGEMAYETVTLTTTTGSKKTFRDFAFGCDLETYLYLGGVDGLVGLGKGPLSFTTQLSALFDNKFSYCLVSVYDSNTTDSLLLFGPDAVPKAPIRYTPMVQNPNATFYGTATFYYIGLTGIKVNGNLLPIPAGAFDFLPDGTGGVISDSGTTLTYLASAGYSPFLSEMTTLITYPPSPYAASIGLDLCYDLANVTTPKFPQVTVVFQGFDLDLPFNNVFIGGPLFAPFINSTTTYCSAFADSFSNFSIFGNVAQQNFQVLHDRNTQMFGYAEVQCDTL